MIVVETNNFVNPIDFPQNNMTIQYQLELEGHGKNRETIFKKYNDIYLHYFFPVSRHNGHLNQNWIQQAQSLFTGIRSFTDEEAEMHTQGLLKLFKPTGRNRHKR
jgi:hypothetical protein